MVLELNRMNHPVAPHKVNQKQSHACQVTLALLPHLSDSSQRRSSAFKGSFGSVSPIQMIQDNQPILRFITLIISVKFLLPYNVMW